MIRLFSLLILLVLAGAVGIFVYQNNGALVVHYWTWDASTTVAAAVGAAYGLGMLSGWAVVGIFRRSLRSVTESRDAYR